MKIKPVEDFILEGLQSRCQQVFGCVAVVTTATDKTKLLARLAEGNDVQYPYMFLTITQLGRNPESYNAHALARRGLKVAVSETQMQTVRLIPAKWDIDVEYHTNQFQSVDQGSVTAFAKRWLFASRCGYLKFNIEYGNLRLSISNTMSESVPIPALENKVEAETVYKVATTMSVMGYVSEPIMGQQGIVNELVVDEVLADSDGAIPGYQFLPFN